MWPMDFGMMNRRGFLKISALWSAAAALNVAPVPAHAAKKPVAGEYDAVVIGAGLGGLTFAGYMAKHGYKVLVVEHHEIPGGYATTFTRDAGRFNFEVSLHQMALSGETAAILEDLDVLKTVRFAKASNLFRLIGPDLDVSCPTADPEKFQESLIDKYPREKKGIEGFVGEMIGLNSEVERFFREGKLSWYHKAVFPVRFPLMWAARNRSFSDYLDKNVSHPELKSILSVFCGYYGLPPARLSGFYYMNATGGYFRHGGSYPYGGSIAISNALVDYITNRGGEVLFNTTARKIHVENNRAVGIQTADGKTLRSRMVAANCSALRLFNDMIAPEHVPKEYRDKIDSFKPSISSFQVWLALKKDITPEIKDSHIFLAPEPDPAKAFEHNLHARADKANLSVCIYNNIYKDYSPPGTTVLSLTFGCGYEPWAGFEKDYRAGNKEAYTAKKREIADTLVRRVEGVLIPDLSSMIVVQDAATPLTNMRYTLNTDGAIYGFEQSLNNSFMNRLSNKTPIKGLYLAGAWGEPGGGYTGVLISGKRTFGMLMEEWGT